MNSLQCPSCKQNIDGDSLYCDQCGEQILVCSLCGRAGKGRRCTVDGKELVPPGTSPSSTEHITQPPVAPPPVKPPTSPAPAPAPVAAGKLKLSAQTHGISMDISEGDVLGRTKGNHTSVLGRFSHISGSHCQILKSNGAWCVMDMGSTNGTFCNGSKLTPNTPVTLQNGARVKLADVEFVASFGAPPDSGTQRI